MFLIKKLTFDRMNFLKLSVHVFCLAEKAKLRRTNSRTNCQENKISVCLAQQRGKHENNWARHPSRSVTPLSCGEYLCWVRRLHTVCALV